VSAPLHTLAPASRRLVLICYAVQHPETLAAVQRCLRDQEWAPMPEDCPVAWVDLRRWYNGLQRTGQVVMDSY
jgi:hypothetical protein